MRRWMRDRVKRRNQKNKNPQQSDEPQQGQAPLQPTFLDRESSWAEPGEGRARMLRQRPHRSRCTRPSPKKIRLTATWRAHPATVLPDAASARAARGRGGRGRNRTDQQQKAAQSSANVPGLPIAPGRRPAKLRKSTNQRRLAEAPDLDAADAAPRKAETPKGQERRGGAGDWTSRLGKELMVQAA